MPYKILGGKRTYSNIWSSGARISGGGGLWSHPAMHQRNSYDIVRAWVDGLREKGYSDADIIAYGDWTDGRHMADNLEGMKSYSEMKKYVKKEARDPKEVRKKNEEAYFNRDDDVIWLQVRKVED